MKNTILLIALILLVSSCAKTALKNHACETPHSSWSSPDSLTSYYIGNIFTPDGNGSNDFFEVLYTGVMTEFTLTVQKGSTVYFSTHDPTAAWDGTKQNGALAKEGVYDYVMNGVLDGYSIHASGDIALSRSAPSKIKSCGLCAPTYSLDEAICTTP